MEQSNGQCPLTRKHHCPSPSWSLYIGDCYSVSWTFVANLDMSDDFVTWPCLYASLPTCPQGGVTAEGRGWT